VTRAFLMVGVGSELWGPNGMVYVSSEDQLPDAIMEISEIPSGSETPHGTPDRADLWVLVGSFDDREPPGGSGKPTLVIGASWRTGQGRNLFKFTGSEELAVLTSAVMSA